MIRTGMIRTRGIGNAKSGRQLVFAAYLVSLFAVACFSPAASAANRLIIGTSSAATPTQDTALPPIKNHPHWIDPTTGKVRDASQSHAGIELPNRVVSQNREQAALMPEFTASDRQWQFPQWLTNWASSLSGWIPEFGTMGWIIVLIIVGVIFLAVMFYILSRMNIITRFTTSKGKVQRRRRPVTKEELPFEFDAAQLTVDGLWEQANQARKQGDYRRALMFLYSFLLIELDSHQLIRISRGKTNRTYANEVQGVSSVAPVFAATMDAFERVFFGSCALESQTVDEIFQRVQQLEFK